MSPDSFPALLPILIVGIFITFFGLIIWLALRTAKTTRMRMEQTAANLGLMMNPQHLTLGIFPSMPKASGERRGKLLELFTYSTGSGKSRTNWAALSAKPRHDAGLTFSLTRQGFGSKIAELFGSREIQVGDPAFDAAWFIQTNRPEFLTAALLPELRARLTAATQGASRGASFKFERGKVVYAEVGTFYDQARCTRFENIADVVCDLADVAEVHASTGR